MNYQVISYSNGSFHARDCSAKAAGYWPASDCTISGMRFRGAILPEFRAKEVCAALNALAIARNVHTNTFFLVSAMVSGALSPTGGI
jgi:hypothetical protein